MAGSSRSNRVTAQGPFGYGAGEIGWLKAHVRLGRSYPLIAVRVCHRATPGGGVLQIFDSEDPTVLRTAAYASATARALDERGARINTIELDASLLGNDAGLLLEFKIEIEAATNELNETHAGETARHVLDSRDWEFVQPVEVRVALITTAVDSASDAPTAADIDDAAQLVEASVVETPDTVVPRRSVWWAVLVAAVVGGLGILAIAALMPSGPAGPQPAVEEAPTAVASEPVVATPAMGAPTSVVEVAAARTTAPPTATQPARTQAGEATPTQAPLGAPGQAVLDFAAGRTSGFAWPNDRQGAGWFDVDGYHLAARKPGRFVAIGVLPSQELHSLLITATFHKVTGPPGGGYGVIVGDAGPEPLDGANQTGRYLVFEVGDKGEVGLWRRDQDQWLQVIGWTPNAAVKSGNGENTLAVRVSGNALGFSVNQADVPVQPTGQAIAGRVGVFLGGDANEAVLSRLTVTPLD